MSDFVMPSLGADMAAATLVKWLVEPGQTIARGDLVAEVETEKGLIEIECFEAGVVETLHATPGSKVAVGERMATIRTAGGSPREKPAEPTPAAGRRVRVSPLARARAAALGVDLAQVSGTGPDGAIDARDVERAAAVTAAKPAPRAEPAAASAAPDDARLRMRHAIAAAMAKSNREIPHYYLQTRIDMTAALAWLQAENATRGIAERVLPAVVLLKATARALRDVPALNGYWIDGQHRPADGVHLGFALALEGGGLVAPAIHDVDTKSCISLMAELRELIPRARSGRLRGSEMTDATLTVTNLGDLGVESVLGVIYPPQVALVGFGRILDQPWLEGGLVVVRPVVTASLAADHRATDGHTGGRFLHALDQHLQSPQRL